MTTINQAFKVVKKQIDDNKVYILNNLDKFMLDDYEQISCFLDDINCMDEYDICVDLAAAYREDIARDIIEVIDGLRDIAAEEEGGFESLYQESGAIDEENNSAAYVTFVNFLKELKDMDHGSVNIWHIEQNDMQAPEHGKKSRRQLCYNVFYSHARSRSSCL